MFPFLDMEQSSRRLMTYNMANFLGLRTKIPVGISAREATNNAKAARLRPPKAKSRSHRLTSGERAR